MANINTVAISGNLTRDPELRHTASGTAVVGIGVAVNRSIKDENAEGGYREEVSFFDATVWGNFGELVARKLRKGDHVTVQGRLKQDTWETDGGEKRYKVQIIAEQIDSEGFFRSKDEDNATSAATESTPEAAPAAAAPAKDDIPF